MEHTTATDNPAIGRTLDIAHAESQVLLKFFLQTIANLAGSAELTLFTEERRVVDGEEHTHRRLVDSDWRQSLGVLEVSDGVTNLEVLQTDNSADVATVDMVATLVRDTLEGMQLLDLIFFKRSVAVANGDVHTILERTSVHTADSDTSCIRTIVERSDQHLRCTL